MPNETLQQRLLRVQRYLESYDSHHEDCRCSFCDAIEDISLIRLDLRLAERQEVSR